MFVLGWRVKYGETAGVAIVGVGLAVADARNQCALRHKNFYCRFFLTLFFGCL